MTDPPSQDDPYRPPPDITPRASRPLPRAYGVLSMVFGALMLSAMLLYLFADGWSTRAPGPDLPPHQAGLMRALARGVVEPSPWEQALTTFWRVLFASTGLTLLVLGVGQLRRRRWALRLTPPWAIVALSGLIFSWAAAVATGTQTIATALPSLILLGPYPVLLLVVFTRRRGSDRRV